jgi:predicted dehydrogenase
MKALVVGTDYFSDRFLYMIGKCGVHAKKLARLPAQLEYDAVFFSGAACRTESIERALDHGLHVFSEQIISESGDASFVDLAKRKGLKLFLGSFDVFNPIIRQAKELLKKVEVLSVRLDRVGPVSHSNINIIEDSVLHGIGALEYVLGDRSGPARIQACFTDKPGSQCTLVMRFGDVNGMVYASSTNQYKERTIDVFCNALRMRGDLIRQELQVLDSKKSDINLCEAGSWSFRRYYVKKREPLDALIRDFLLRDRNPVDYGFIKSVLRTAFEAKRMFAASRRASSHLPALPRPS